FIEKAVGEGLAALRTHMPTRSVPYVDELHRIARGTVVTGEELDGFHFEPLQTQIDSEIIRRSLAHPSWSSLLWREERPEMSREHSSCQERTSETSAITGNREEPYFSVPAPRGIEQLEAIQAVPTAHDLIDRGRN